MCSSGLQSFYNGFHWRRHWLVAVLDPPTLPFVTLDAIIFRRRFILPLININAKLNAKPMPS